MGNRSRCEEKAKHIILCILSPLQEKQRDFLSPDGEMEAEQRRYRPREKVSDPLRTRNPQFPALPIFPQDTAAAQDLRPCSTDPQTPLLIIPMRRVINLALIKVFGTVTARLQLRRLKLVLLPEAAPPICRHPKHAPRGEQARAQPKRVCHMLHNHPQQQGGKQQEDGKPFFWE